MEELLLLNEWWDTGRISEEKAKPYRRKVFSSVSRTLFGYRQVLMICGLRRVGKTTVVYQLVEELLKRGVDPKHILYFSFDEGKIGIMNLLEEYARITQVDWRKETCYVFFDEIQKIPGWSATIKLLYDSVPSIRLCVSGSASLALETSAIKDLAGRHFSETIGPLTLQEFAELYFGKDISLRLHQQELKRVFDSYIQRPFPEIVRWNDPLKVRQYLRELVVEKIVRADIPDTFKKVNSQLLSALSDMFLGNAGMTLDLTALAREQGVNKATLARHLRFLEASGLITMVKNYRPSIRAESRKMKKIYPSVAALSFCMHPGIDKGQIAETLVCSAMRAGRYWRKGEKEVDFLLTDPLLPVEVKAKDTISAQDIKTMLYFLRTYKIKKGVVVYTGPEQAIRRAGKTILLVPLQKLLFDFHMPA